jgi:hypothetical protein
VLTELIRRESNPGIWLVSHSSHISHEAGFEDEKALCKEILNYNKGKVKRNLTPIP